MAKRKSLKSPRNKAFREQNGFCYYCSSPMWLDESDLISFTKDYLISTKQAQKLKCTGEHLVPHKHGGKSSTENIVAACYFCNSRRHARGTDLTPNKYKKLVRSRVKAGRWTSSFINTKLLRKNCSRDGSH